MDREKALEIVGKMKLSPGKDAELIIALHTLIPELAESEDEKTRKSLLAYIKKESKRLDTKKWISYLEKLKEQKSIGQIPSEFALQKAINVLTIQITPLNEAKDCGTVSDEDKQYLSAYVEAREFLKGLLASSKEQKPVSYSPLCNTIKDKIREYVANNFVTDTVVKTDVKSIVKAMEEGVRLGKEEQKPTKWNEEDTKMLNNILLHLNMPFHEMNDVEKRMFTWLQELPKKFYLKQKSAELDEGDEKIREKLLECCTSPTFEIQTGIKNEVLKNWLEKQKERKPAESSNDGVIQKAYKEGVNDGIALVKKQPEDYGLCKPAEWGEEDDKKIHFLINLIERNIPDATYSFGDGCKNGRISKKEAIEMLKSLRPQPREEIYQAAKHYLAIKFMNYLDENRPEGKMSLSNGECEDIDKAFKENDLARIMRYVEKYRPS